MIDAHSHVHSMENLEGILRRAKIFGVEKIITCGVNLRDSIECLKVSRNYEMLFACVGLHPKENLNELEAVLNLIENTPDIVAVGEIGLDYRFGKNERQVKPFVEQIKLAIDLELPVVVHSRSAGKYVIEILEKNGAEKVLLHSFDGSAKLVNKIVSLGYFVSIPVTVLKSEHKQKLAKALPLENLLLESDSPALSPFNKINEPSNLIYSLNFISKIKEIEPKDLDKITTKNAKELFKI